MTPNAPVPSAQVPPAPATDPAMAPVTDPAVAAATGQSGEDDEAMRTLPTLSRDGYTVVFDSSEAYRSQLDHNLRHGALVVRSTPLPIGTQRMLALQVPGQAPYTVSARVMFSDAGKLGFMLDSFNLHKARLEGLAG